MLQRKILAKSRITEAVVPKRISRLRCLLRLGEIAGEFVRERAVINVMGGAQGGRARRSSPR